MTTAPAIERTTGTAQVSKQPLLMITREVAEYITEVRYPHMEAGAKHESGEKGPVSFELVEGPFAWLFTPIAEESALVSEESEPHIAIWERPHIRAMLREHVGAPIFLTREEAIEIARSSFASEPDLPSGEEYVRKVRPLLGRAILRKFRKTGG
jgi:hypothetical protein